MAPVSQLPSMAMAALPVPKASPPQPVPRSEENFRTPSVRSVLTSVRPATEPSELAVASVPSALVRPPPACAMKAPTRAYSGLQVRPTTSPLVRVLATAAREAQSVGRSASVRPAAVHISELMNSARVEKSLGAP